LSQPESTNRRTLRFAEQAASASLILLALAVIVWQGFGTGQESSDLAWNEAEPSTSTVAEVADSSTPLRFHQASAVQKDSAPPQYQVDINTADWPALTLLPNIGETLARRIVAHREANGAFHRVDDLTNVRGIGEKTLAHLKPHCFVAPTSPEVLVQKSESKVQSH